MKLNIRKSGLIVASASALVTMAQCDAGLFDLFHKKKKPEIEQRMPNKDCSFGYHATTWQPWDTCHLTEPCDTGCGSNSIEAFPDYPSESMPSHVTPHFPEEHRIPDNHLESLPEPTPQLNRRLRFPKTTTIRGPVGNDDAVESKPAVIQTPQNTLPRIENSDSGSRKTIDTQVGPKRLLLPNQDQPVPTPLNPTAPFEPQRSRSLPSIPAVDDNSNAGGADPITLPLPTTTPVPGGQLPAGQLPSQLPTGEPVQVPAADGSVRHQQPGQFGTQPLQPTSFWQQDNNGIWRVMPGYYQAQQPAGARRPQQPIQQYQPQPMPQYQQSAQQYLQQPIPQRQQPQMFRQMQVLPQNARPMQPQTAQSRVEFLPPPQR